MAKALALWNLQNRSTQAADIIMAEVSRRLVVPNATRWNSTFDAISCLNGLLSSNR